MAPTKAISANRTLPLADADALAHAWTPDYDPPDANQRHREDFTTLQDAAAKQKPQGGQT
jgi:hypothetical protein